MWQLPDALKRILPTEEECHGTFRLTGHMKAVVDKIRFPSNIRMDVEPVGTITSGGKFQEAYFHQLKALRKLISINLAMLAASEADILEYASLQDKENLDERMKKAELLLAAQASMTHFFALVTEKRRTDQVSFLSSQKYHPPKFGKEGSNIEVLSTVKDLIKLKKLTKEAKTLNPRISKKPFNRDSRGRFQKDNRDFQNRRQPYYDNSAVSNNNTNTNSNPDTNKSYNRPAKKGRLGK